MYVCDLLGAHEMDQIGLILDTVHLSDNEWNKVTQILPRNFIQRHSRTPEKPLADLITSVDIDGRLSAYEHSTCPVAMNESQQLPRFICLI